MALVDDADPSRRRVSRLTHAADARARPRLDARGVCRGGGEDDAPHSSARQFRFRSAEGREGAGGLARDDVTESHAESDRTDELVQATRRLGTAARRSRQATSTATACAARVRLHGEGTAGRPQVGAVRVVRADRRNAPTTSCAALDAGALRAGARRARFQRRRRGRPRGRRRWAVGRWRSSCRATRRPTCACGARCPSSVTRVRVCVRCPTCASRRATI